jgi:hypothetical protein
LREEADGSAEAFDDGLGNAESQPRAAFLARIGDVGLGKLLEDARAEFVGDAGTEVANFHAHADAHAQDGDGHGGPLRRELDGVREEVGDDLAEAVVVDARS